MKITDIDKNFIQQSSDDDTVWLDVKKAPFKIYGLLYDEEDILNYCSCGCFLFCHGLMYMLI